MKAFVITIKNHELSEKAANTLIHSSIEKENDFIIEKFPAIYPDIVEETMERFDLKWNWTWKGSRIEEKSGLQQHPYGCRNPKRKMACALSHYILWKKCFEENEALLIFEHDSIFLEHLNADFLEESNFDVIGLNSPFHTTRLPRRFNDIVKKSKEKILPIPQIDNDKVPQGLAGNSAYFMKPNGAKNVLLAVEKYGLWHNDAILCKQLIPNMGVTSTYFTQVQGLKSTTCGA